MQQIASGPTVVVVGLCLAGGNGWQALPAADFLEAEERVVPLPPTVVADPLGMPIVPPSGLGGWLENSARGGEEVRPPAIETVAKPLEEFVKTPWQAPAFAAPTRPGLLVRQQRQLPWGIDAEWRVGVAVDSTGPGKGEFADATQWTIRKEVAGDFFSYLHDRGSGTLQRRDCGDGPVGTTELLDDLLGGEQVVDRQLSAPGSSAGLRPLRGGHFTRLAALPRAEAHPLKDHAHLGRRHHHALLLEGRHDHDRTGLLATFLHGGGELADLVGLVDALDVFLVDHRGKCSSGESEVRSVTVDPASRMTATGVRHRMGAVLVAAVFGCQGDVGNTVKDGDVTQF